ncbi:MliC family protein [Candidatus Tisiphia endosymbiont of Sialis lutaria]|uniref:MliC family protein n=1 Tax=Candidatus Tisiphia endosymbiont of Sialis lutaria TaxID=2029164 RepID=UPI00312C7DC2
MKINKTSLELFQSNLIIITIFLVIIFIILVSCKSYKDQENLIIPGNGNLQVENVNYSCIDGRKINIQYLNKGANTLAIIPIAEENQILIFTGRVSASGVLYGANQYEWHTKNKTAILRNINTDSTVFCDEIE